MEFRLFLEWNERCGISLSNTYPMTDGIEGGFNGKDYGPSISKIRIVMSCLDQDIKPRWKYDKVKRIFDYDIVLEFYPIKHMSMDEKKTHIRQQIVEISERTLAEYEFEDFNKELFLADLRQIASTFSW